MNTPENTDQDSVESAALFGFLANDITRCDGAGSVEDGVQYWREGCETCLRRTALRRKVVSMMSPPAIIAFECEYMIEPNVPDEVSPEAGASVPKE